MVRLGFSPAPVHVRTARLVAVAVARRAGVSEDVLDEVRLAVGEACSRAVALHQYHKRTELIELEMTDDQRFTVRVLDRAPGGVGPHADPLSDPTALVAPTEPGLAESGLVESAEPFAEESVAAGMGLALLTGLVDDLQVAARPDGDGTVVTMSWPVHL